MGELASRPRLQTMYSIAVANPFSPRPDGIYGDLPLSKIPPLPLDYDWNCSTAKLQYRETSKQFRALITIIGPIFFSILPCYKRT